MHWIQSLSRAKLILVLALLLFPLLFSAVANVAMQRTLSYARSTAEQLDAVFAKMRRFSGRLALSEGLVTPVDIADVLTLQQRLEETPPPDPMVTEYFVSIDRYLIGMGYSFVRPDLFYRGRVLPVGFSGTELRSEIESSDFAMTLIRNERTQPVPTTLLVAYDLPRIGPGAHAKTVALIDLSRIIRDSAAAVFQVSTSGDELLFVRNPGQRSQRTLIQSDVLPLSYVTVHTNGLLRTPFYQVLLLSFCLALLVIAGDVAAFAHRLLRIDARDLMFYRQRLASAGRPGALLVEYLQYTSFGLRTSRARLHDLVSRWMQRGDVSNLELDMILLALGLPAHARHCVVYFEDGAMLRTRSAGVVVRPLVHGDRHSYGIVSVPDGSAESFRSALSACFDGGTGVGNLCLEAAQLPTSFLEAKEAYNRRADDGQAATIAFFADLPAIQWESFHFPIDVEANLLNSIRVANTERFTAIVHELYEQNRRAYSSSERMWSAFVHNMQCSLLKLLPEIKYRDNREGLLIKEQILEITDSPRSSETVIAICRRMAQLFLSSRESRQNELFQSIKRYIDESFRDQSLSLKVLAAEFDLSESHISRNIKERLGLPYHHYVEQLRLDYAARQIVETGYTLSDIALKSGYANLNTFRKAFVRRFSLSPQAYRRRRLADGAPDDGSSDEDRALTR